ncbi:hypothetical protein [Hansschlegelia sp.]|uniref:hypothetical protein n=1 Tax=Hansschlegelia sp. TaxID=2041892 RepID=UPI002C104982|nr:hypothetical protein [Hansschlegelia sp.]HVI28603.1 hypothetical protein [Hansschlegelia sp.]
MALLKRFIVRPRAERVAAPGEIARSEHGTDLVMIVLLGLIFAPIVAMHLAFAFGDGSASAAPAQIQHPQDAR